MPAKYSSKPHMSYASQMSYASCSNWQTPASSRCEFSGTSSYSHARDTELLSYSHARDTELLSYSHACDTELLSYSHACDTELLSYSHACDTELLILQTTHSTTPSAHMHRPATPNGCQGVPCISTSRASAPTSLSAEACNARALRASSNHTTFNRLSSTAVQYMLCCSSQGYARQWPWPPAQLTASRCTSGGTELTVLWSTGASVDAEYKAPISTPSLSSTIVLIDTMKRPRVVLVQLLYQDKLKAVCACALAHSRLCDCSSTLLWPQVPEQSQAQHLSHPTDTPAPPCPAGPLTTCNLQMTSWSTAGEILYHNSTTTE
jgi:hypothetical protein